MTEGVAAEEQAGDFVALHSIDIVADATFQHLQDKEADVYVVDAPADQDSAPLTLVPTSLREDAEMGPDWAIDAIVRGHDRCDWAHSKRASVDVAHVMSTVARRKSWYLASYTCSCFSVYKVGR